MHYSIPPPETVRPGSPSTRSGWHGGIVAAAALCLCSMVAIAAALTPDSQAPGTTAATEEASSGEVSVAQAFAGGLTMPEIERPSAEQALPNSRPDEPRSPQAERPAREPASPRPRKRRSVAPVAAASSGSQFLAVLVQRPPSREPGTLVARARGGSCRFWIDGVMSGEGRVVRVPAQPGPHNVACRSTADGSAQVQRVQVAAGGIVVAAFHP